MLYVSIGSISFLFFVLSDLNEILFQRKILCVSFPFGCLTLACATTLMILFKPADLNLSPPWILLAGLVAIVSFTLLIFSLSVVHGKQEHQQPNLQNKKLLYDRGLYAMCRHPGVLFFALFYLSFALALERTILLWAGCFFSILNIAYSLYQDRSILPKLLADYDRYHNRTPFLIPTADSLHRGIMTLRSTDTIVE